MRGRVDLVDAARPRPPTAVRVVVYGADLEQLTRVAQALFRRGKNVRVYLGDPARLGGLSAEDVFAAATSYPEWRADLGADWREIVQDYFAHCLAKRNFHRPLTRTLVLAALARYGLGEEDLDRYIEHLKALKRERPAGKPRPKRGSHAPGEVA